jgi:enoyl-[acyl-carrier-protein] reductase (NADH)
MGVVGITQSLAKEVATENITVNAFCPGIIETDMWAYNDQAWGKLLGNYGPGELMKEWVDGIPMKRAGSGDDVAGLVTFLASHDAKCQTGPLVTMDHHGARWSISGLRGRKEALCGGSISKSLGQGLGDGYRGLLCSRLLCLWFGVTG